MLQELCLDSVKIISVDYDVLIETLKEVAKDLKAKNPAVKRIMLFGSFLKGNYTPESDVDLLIIVGKTETPFLCRADSFIEFFKGIPLDVNILVYTEKEINTMVEKGNEFIIEILRQGREL